MPLERRKPWKRISDKRLAGLDDRRRQRDGDIAFFTEIWEERGGVCEVTGESLGPEPLSTMFHHILPKAKYPQYRYCKWNILMVQPQIHAQIENDISKVPVAEAIYQRLLATKVQNR